MKGRLPSEFDDRNAHEEGRFLLPQNLLCRALLWRLYVPDIAALFSPLSSIPFLLPAVEGIFFFWILKGLAVSIKGKLSSSGPMARKIYDNTQ